MRLRRKIKLRRRTPTADFFVISGACAHGHGRMWNIGDGEEKFALRGVEFGDALVGLLDALGNLLHFGNEGISVFLLFLQAGDFLAGFIALRLELLGCGDEFAALFVELAKGVQVKRGATPFRHFGKDIKMISEIVQVMHGVGRSEEHTSELQSLTNLVCRLLLEKKKRIKKKNRHQSNLQRTDRTRH